jgi:diguanylate cyclase (GGDEF)-like protein
MAARVFAGRGKSGNACRMGGSTTDITRFKLTEEQLQHDAFHDTLTGLANRALFTDRLARAVQRTKTDRTYCFAVLFLDLDRFKVVNDSLGHEAGDHLLVETARRLESCIRDQDTVARLGGDEFTILIEEADDPTEATRVAERIQKAIKKPFVLGGQEAFTTASIGIAFSQTGYDNPNDILRDADIAMYRAKMAGKARHEVFDHRMHAKAVELLQLESDLRRSIQREELEVHYQPIVVLESGEISGFEALVRWRHPQRGLMSPGEFLPIAEETGLIIPMGWWILREACRQTRTWQKRFPDKSNLTVSVNLSPKHLSQPDVVQQIEQALKVTSLPPKTLKLEITEGAIMEDSAIEPLEKLKALKVDLHLDDFGTGYSSLRYLHKFPIDASKIDRSFIAKVVEDAETQQIVKAMVTLSHALGMKVVAEGVETADQAAYLRDLDCEYGQGFLYSPAIEGASAERMLESLLGVRAQRDPVTKSA